MASLNVDKAALSRLIAIATRVPAAVIDAIGPAPAFGRVRWQELTDLLDQDGNRARALESSRPQRFTRWTPISASRRLAAMLRTKAVAARAAENWSANDGTHAAKVARVGKRLTLTFDDRVAPQFGDFVRENAADASTTNYKDWRIRRALTQLARAGMSRLDRDQPNRSGEP